MSVGQAGIQRSEDGMGLPPAGKGGKSGKKARDAGRERDAERELAGQGPAAETAADPEGDPDGLELPPGRYFDREESWLRFNQRVLELAEDDSLPLLERVRFLAIFASNLDEFFMVRVAGRMRRMATGLPVEGVSGLPPEQILERTLDTARELSLRHAEYFNGRVVPALAAEGIEILRWK